LKENIMTQNTGQLDRIIRMIAGFALAAWAVLGTDQWHQLGWLGVILIATAAIGFCPLYRIVGLSTCPTPKRR
jgi:hypothetical protein